jgi:hypothetical protein
MACIQPVLVALLDGFRMRTACPNAEAEQGDAAQAHDQWAIRQGAG